VKRTRSTTHRRPFCLAAFGLVFIVASTANLAVAQLQVTPARVELDGPDSRWTLLVDSFKSDDILDGTKFVLDVTRDAVFASENPEIATVNTEGVVRGVNDGATNIRVTVDGQSKIVSVTVRNSKAARTFHFENDVIPIFSRFGCNASGCHGKAEGQNGFKLSIFGFAPDDDHAALVQEGRGRRTVPTIPEKSLLLLKASGGMPHGGGVRIRRNSGEYRVLHGWISAGTPMGESNAAKVVGLSLFPELRHMRMESTQQLQVIAEYSDGRRADVTHHAKFQTNNELIAKVDEYGRVRSNEIPGESAVMASYMGAVAVFRSVIPQTANAKIAFPERPVLNFIDPLVDERLKSLNIHPSELCTDADFLRRSYLDIIGTLPTRAESRAFLDSKDVGKRAKLVDQLVKRPEYADYWALKWSDLLRVDRLKLGHKPAYSYYRWIHSSFKKNQPFDQFAKQVVAANGMISRNPAANLYKVVPKPGDVASTISQVFLGVRIECAQCHHHPFDRWSQEDYAGMKAYFTQVKFKTIGGDQMLMANDTAETKHPRSGAVVEAHALLQPAPEATPEGDRRVLFGQWMTSPDNQWFARNFVNRMWAHFLGRGIVEPVDDVRQTNPPTNPALLDALAKSFVESKFDVRALIKTITASRTYQLSVTPVQMNQVDEQNYSRALLKKIDAEVRFDMICQVTGIPEKFKGMPQGYRAIQLWDSQVKHYFLKLFGRPVRASACECERTTEPSVSQVLHMLNSPGIQSKLSDDGGQIVKLEASIKDNEKLATELILLIYNRYPSNDELQGISSFLEKTDNRRRAAEDVVWSLMNTIEFAFNH
jgi:hypothetical protein